MEAGDIARGVEGGGLRRIERTGVEDDQRLGRPIQDLRGIEPAAAGQHARARQAHAVGVARDFVEARAGRGGDQARESAQPRSLRVLHREVAEQDHGGLRLAQGTRDGLVGGARLRRGHAVGQRGRYTGAGVGKHSRHGG